MHWFFKDASGRQAANLLCLTVLFQIVYVSILAVVWVLVQVNRADPLEPTALLFAPTLPNLFVAAFSEEVVFRFVPLSIALAGGFTFAGIMGTAVVSSVIFGLGHGGIAHIGIQGVAGFVWCLLFLKCGGFHRHYVRATLVTTMGHVLYNLSVFAIAAFIALL